VQPKESSKTNFAVINEADNARFVGEILRMLLELLAVTDTQLRVELPSLHPVARLVCPLP